MSTFNKTLLKNNKNWAEEVKAENKDFFKELAKGQAPPALWIGCSDSRVPAAQVTGARPGDLFVHRNIANLVVESDLNLLSVIEYAVTHLKVEHVIVCGHYGCGGVQAAMSNDSFGIIDPWIKSIKNVYAKNEKKLTAIKKTKDRFDKMVELNVEQQVQNLANTSIIQAAWKERKAPQIHGWVFDLGTGLLKDLKTTIKGSSSLTKVHKFK